MLDILWICKYAQMSFEITLLWPFMKLAEQSINFENKLSKSWKSESKKELELRYFSNLFELSAFLLLAGGTSKQAGVFLVFPLEQQPGTLQAQAQQWLHGKTSVRKSPPMGKPYNTRFSHRRNVSTYNGQRKYLLLLTQPLQT